MNVKDTEQKKLDPCLQQETTRSNNRGFVPSPLPENLRRLQWDKCIGVTRDNPGRKVVCRTCCGNQRRVAPNILADQGFAPNHDLPNRLVAIGSIGVEFNLDRVRIHFVQMDLNIEAMMLACALDLD